MNQIRLLGCEACSSSRRLGGAFYMNEPGPSDPEPLIPCHVLACLEGPGRARCARCGHELEGKAGELGPCPCGASLRLQPTKYVNPFDSCSSFSPRIPRK